MQCQKLQSLVGRPVESYLLGSKLLPGIINVNVNLAPCEMRMAATLFANETCNHARLVCSLDLAETRALYMWGEKFLA
jgi:hypothetical protein